MCSRYSLYTQQQTLEQYFKISFDHLTFHPRYNIAPFQKILCVRENDSTPTAEYLTWGIKLNDWYRGVINARSETVASKPLFSTAFRTKRCLIIADGFYEWKREEKSKIPHYFLREDRKIMYIAGIYENNEFCLITEEASKNVNKIHHRQPVVLNEVDVNRYLNLELSGSDFLNECKKTKFTFHEFTRIKK